ncbi:MAG: branched-chain amino acid ABC transporter permease [Pseudomonadota bacterium]|nr:branched-chain amino acid ABC transporter permease [Pseudomonadota bacterium]
MQKASSTTFARTRTDLYGIAAILAVATIIHLFFPTSLSFIASVIAIMFLVISLDLVTGVTGVATLGQSALFGAGAYAAGIAAVNGIHDPFVLLVIGLIAGGVAGVVTGAIILRTHGLPQLVLSIALVQLAAETVNRATRITGGSDGLTGMTIAPVFGRFQFDLWGVTAFWLSVALLVVVVFFARRLTRSPFGMLCRAIRQDKVRVESMGIGTYTSALKMYVIAGCIAGLGGALMAITTQVVGLDSLSFTLSAEALVMLILGGSGTIFGAVIGTFFFMWMEHQISAANPYHWLAIVGVILIVVVMVAPRGLYGTALHLIRSWREKRAAAQELDQ